MFKKFLLFTFLSIVLASSISAYAQPKVKNITTTANIPDTILTVEGNTFPGASITVMLDGAVAGTTSANSAGAFSKSLTSQTPGMHNIKIFAKDLATNTYTDTISQNVNLQAQTETTVDFFLPSTLEVLPTKVIVGRKINFSGKTIPGGSVRLVVDNNLILTATADSSGKWSKDLDTSKFYIGTHNVYVVASNSSGELSPPSQKRSFVVEKVKLAPGESPEADRQQPADSATQINKPVIDFPRNNQRFDYSPITLRGSGSRNTQIELYDGSEMIGSSFINARGEWFISIELVKERYDLRLRSCSGGECSEFSDTVTIFFDGRVNRLYAWLDRYRYFGIGSEQKINLNLFINGGQPPYFVSIDWGDDTIERTNSTYDRELGFTKLYKSPGLYSGLATVSDINGNATSVAFSVEVIDSDFAAWFDELNLLLIILLVVLLIALFIAHRYSKRAARRLIAKRRRKQNKRTSRKKPAPKKRRKKSKTSRLKK